jgi:precorrin-2 dehydrogenase/sirohydrochlorin ferrochelatase
MYNYPIYLTLEAASCVVVGAGKVGRRKIASLFQAKAAEILVFDPAVTDEGVADIEATPNVRVFRRAVKKGDLEGKRLVFAASSDSRENARVAALCSSLNVLCNVADAPELGVFIVPAVTETFGLMAAFSTDGKSPALVRRIKEDALSWLDSSYGPLLQLIGRIRPLVLGLGFTSDENAMIFRALVYSRLGELLVSGERNAVKELVALLLPAPFHCHIEELLDGLC